MKYYPHFILIICLFFDLQLFAQKITPHTQNNGGGYAQSFEWSIGESISVNYFSTEKIRLNTGVLQPLLNVVTSVNNFGPAVFGNQITLGPNPTFDILHFKAFFTSAGNLKLQLLDSKSNIVANLAMGSIAQTYNRDITLSQYPSGVYYLKVFFMSNSAINRIGVYKIVKL